MKLGNAVLTKPTRRQIRQMIMNYLKDGSTDVVLLPSLDGNKKAQPVTIDEVEKALFS